MPGGAWRRLYSARSTRRIVRATRVGVQAFGDELLGRAVELHVALENAVQQLVWRQRVGVALIRSQLRRRRTLDDRLRDRARRAAESRGGLRAVAPAAEVVDEGLRHILDDREPACEVAVERRVADGHLGLVSCRQDQPAELVGECHQEIPADPRLQVLLRDVGRGGAELSLQRLVVSPHHSLDRKLAQVRAKPRRELPRVLLCGARGVRRGHHDDAHAIRPQGVRRKARDERRVDTPREAQADVAKAVLLDVITQSQAERGIDLGLARREFRAQRAAIALARRRPQVRRPPAAR